MRQLNTQSLIEESTKPKAHVTEWVVDWPLAAFARNEERLPPDRLARMFKARVNRALRKLTHEDADFALNLVSELGVRSLEKTVFKRGYRIDDFEYDGQDNYELMDKLLRRVAREWKHPASGWSLLKRQKGMTQGEKLLDDWQRFKSRVARKRNKGGTHAFSYE